MAIEFKNGIVIDSTGTVLDVQGSQGQLFSVTDSLTGDLFSVSDISGVPILNVNSSGAVDIDGTLTISTIAAATSDTDKFLVSDSGVLKFRTGAEILTDIGAQASGSYAAALGGDDNYVTDAEKTVIGNTSGSNSGDVCSSNHTGAGYLTSLGSAIVDGDFTGTSGFMKKSSAGTYTLDSSSYITSQRAIDDSPTDGSTTTSISSNWAFDNVKTAVPTGAVFTDTVNTLAIGTGSGDAMAGNTSIPSISGLASTTYVDTAESDAIAAAATAGNSAYVALSGSTMTGALTLSGSPTNNSHAATKAYVDGAIIADTDTQNLSISGRTIGLDRGGSVTVPAPTYASVTGKPATFAPILGTSSSTALAGNTDIPSGNQILDWTANIAETVIHAGNYINTVYVHPSYATTNINTSNATIIDSITTNSTGHITAMGTRTLTLANLGFSGNSAANCVLNASQTLTNKVIDADNNTISDLVVSNLKASAIVLESEGIGSNDNDTTIPTSAAVKDYVDSAVIADTDTQDLTQSGDTVSLDRGGSVDISNTTAVAANTTKTSFPGFGTSNSTALRGDTSIPSISGLATTSYVDTAETDAIAAAATAGNSAYVALTGSQTITGTKTIEGSLILDDGTGASPTMRFMNEDDDEVSIFCNASGKMRFQQKLVGGSNVVQMTMDENGLVIDNGLKIGSGALVTTIEDNDSLGTSDTKLATQGNIKAYADGLASNYASAAQGTLASNALPKGGGTMTGALTLSGAPTANLHAATKTYVDSAISGAGGGTMSNFTVRDDGGNDHTIDQGEFIQFDGVNCTFNRFTNPGTNNTSTPLVMQVTVPKGKAENDFLICGTDVADNDFIRVNGNVVEGRTAAEVLSDIGAQASGTYSTATGVENDADVTDATNVAAAGALMDGNFTANGLMKRTNLGAYSVTTDNSSNWDTAYGWGDHSVAGYLTSVTVPNNHIGLARMAHGTDGELITYNSSGVPAHVAVGTSGHILTSNGAGSAPTFQAASGGYSLPVASQSALGGVKIGYSANGKNYPVQITSQQMYVNVPWENNTERGAGSMLDVDNSGDLAVDLTEAAAATIAAADHLIFLDGGATGAESKGSVGGLAAALTNNTSGLTTSSGIIQVNAGSGIELNTNKVTVKLDPTNTGLELSQVNGLKAKVTVNGGIGVDAGQGLVVNSDMIAIHTLRNTALKVGYATNQMYIDYSNGHTTSGNNGSIDWYWNTTELMELSYEGALDVLDNVTADSQVLTSDRRLKKNIETLNYGLDEVLKLKPVRYEWKESYKTGKGSMIGFVSQDVQEVIPEVINESKIVGTEKTKLGIDYAKMVAVLTNAIQEQQKQIDELKKMINGNTN